MSFIVNTIYLLCCVYSMYTIIGSGIDLFFSPTIHYTTEYDLHHILSNSNVTFNTLKQVSIDRTSYKGVFIVNHTHSTINSTINNTINSTINDTTLITSVKSYLIHYGLIFPQDDMTNTVNRFINGTDIRVEYYDRETTILDMFSLNSLVYYFLFFIIIKIFISLFFSLSVTSAVTQQMESVEKLLGEIDMAVTIDAEPIRFTDVVGLVEAKQQLMKYVDIIKNRDAYASMGATIPKGVLLCGPPGCGKTLLAKAVAGEAGVTFISVCGSDFDQMFVGVGSARVKKLFEIARASAPCILFIDEIDSVGEKRNIKSQRGGTGAETLNKILAEMDGFKRRDNIMVLASTNRESTLDSALLRSGRFDSKIYVDTPNRKERKELYDLYLRKLILDSSIIATLDENTLEKSVENESEKIVDENLVDEKLDDDQIVDENLVDEQDEKIVVNTIKSVIESTIVPTIVPTIESTIKLPAEKIYVSLINVNTDELSNKLAKMSPGATGADIANICNQAAINAVYNKRLFVTEHDLYLAIDDVTIGIEKKSKQSKTNELNVTAYHEAGHALISYLLKDAMPPMKISIIPRGQGIAGYTLPQENESDNSTKEELIGQVYILLAGRCAEIVKFKKFTTGASNDFEKATKIITAMITQYGMYKSLMVLDINKDSSYGVSDLKRYEIENLIQSELNKIYDNVVVILEKHFDQLTQLSEKLLENEIMDYDQIKDMFPDLENSININSD